MYVQSRKIAGPSSAPPRRSRAIGATSCGLSSCRSSRSTVDFNSNSAIGLGIFSPVRSVAMRKALSTETS